MSIKVLAISNYRDYHTARPEASIFHGLAKLDFDVHIMTYGDCQHAQEFRESGITVEDFHPEEKFNKGESDRIRKYLIDHKIEVLQLFNSPAIINGLRAAKGLPVKIVLYRGFSGNIHWYDPTAYLKFLHPRVDKIFCNSIGVAEHIDRNTLFGKSKTVVINKGHDVNWYSSYTPCDIKKELDLQEDAFLLVNVANNRRMKGIKYLLDGINQLPEDKPIHLLLIGNDMDNEENRRILARGNKADKVHFLGFRKNVLDIVSSCDVFVLSSIMGESITKSVIEAMSLGVPPIITNIAGNKELCVHEKSGLVVPMKNGKKLAEAIVRIYEDDSLRTALGQGAKKHIEEVLNYEQTIQKVSALYQSLVEKN